MNALIKQYNLSKDGTSPILSSWIAPEGKFGFAELRSIEETTAVITYLNGLVIAPNVTLRVGRPKGYLPDSLDPLLQSLNITLDPPLVPSHPQVITLPELGNLPAITTSPSQLGSRIIPVSSLVDLTNVLMISNLPATLTMAEIRELFSSFGEILNLNLIKTPQGVTQNVVINFADPSSSTTVLESMNNLDFSGFRLSIQRVPPNTAALLIKPVNSLDEEKTENEQKEENDVKLKETKNLSSNVIVMSNMTIEEDLVDDELFNELIQDIKEECEKHSKVISINISRKKEEIDTKDGEDDDIDKIYGKVFIEFQTNNDAEKVLKVLIGRKFNNQIIKGKFFPSDIYNNEIIPRINKENIENKQNKIGENLNNNNKIDEVEVDDLD